MLLDTPDVIMPRQCHRIFSTIACVHNNMYIYMCILQYLWNFVRLEVIYKVLKVHNILVGYILYFIKSRSILNNINVGTDID